jgi:Asp/Glu/hydantoin racemase
MTNLSNRRFIPLAIRVLLLATLAGAATIASAQTQPFAPGYPTITSVPVASPPYQPGPNRIAKGPDGNIWYTFTYSDDNAQGYIQVVSPQGALVATLATQGYPTAITSGTSGDFYSMWFIEQVNQVWYLGRISTANPAGSGCPNTTPCISLETAIPYQQYGPSGTVAPTPNALTNAFSSAGDNGIYITDTSNPIIWRANPNGQGTFSWTAIPIDAPSFGIALGPDNNIWFTEYAFFDAEEYDIGNIGYINLSTPAYAITTFPLPQDYESPTTFDAITTGPDLGSLWFSQYLGSQIYSISINAAAGTSPTFQYTVPNSATLNDMTLGPDLAIWFTQTFIPGVPLTLGRLALNNGVLTASSVNVNSNGQGFVQPYGIAVGPLNDDLWFTDSGADVLGDVGVIPRLIVTPVALPNAPLGAAYSTNLVAGTASGGTPPYENWQVATGYSLPAGLTLNAATGVISGTPTGSLGTTNFNITVNDTNPPFNQLSAAQQFSITVVAGAPAIITATSGGGQTAQVNSAFANPLVATVTDASGNPVSGASVTFTAPVAGASGTFAGNAVVLTNALGMATSPAFSANTIAGGPYNVIASLNSLSASFALTNSPGPAAGITATSGGGQSAPVNSAFANPLVATVKDTYGNPVPGVNVTFTAPGSGASGTFAGNATVSTNAAGVATSPAFSANAVAGGPYNVSASVNGLSSSATFALTNTAGAPASITATSGSGQSAQIGQAFANPLVATVKDASGNPVSGASVTFSAPGSGASGTFAGNPIVQTNASGVATSPVFTANTIAGGPYSVTAAVNGLSASFTLTNTPGPPASVTATSGSGQTAQVNHAFANPLVATVTDASGNLVPGVNVTFSAPSSGASGTFAGSPTVQTNASGVAISPTFTANATAGGPYTVGASVNGVSGSASFSLTNIAGPPATITVTSGSGQSTQVNTAFGNPLVATVKDASGNPVSGASVTFTAPGSGASGTFAGNSTVQTNASGVATSSAFTANAVAGGPYSVTASVNGLSTSFALTNTPGPPASITATSGGGQSAQVNHAFANPLVATVKDANNNPVSGVNVTFTAPASGASGTFAGSPTVQTNASGVATSPVFTANATAGGPYIVTAAVNGVSGSGSFSLTNTAGAPASITAASGSGQSAQVNHAFANPLVATVKDANNNPVSGVNVTFTAPAAGASGTFAGGTTTATVPTNTSGVATSPAFTANATAGGPYSVTAAVNGLSTSFALTNTAGPPGSITATSGSGQSAQVKAVFANPLVATVKDANNNPVSGVSVTFSAPASGASGTFPGSATTAIVPTNASGVATSPAFTANATAGGPYNVTASANGVSSPAAFALTNTVGAPAGITATSGGGQSAQVNQLFADKLVATVKDAYGNPIPAASVTFTAPAAGASGTFAGGSTTATVKTSSSGVATSPAFTANAKAGSYAVTASLNGLSASFALTNTAGSPGSITATSGSGQSALIKSVFTSPLVATVKDANGNVVSGADVTFTAPPSGASGTFAGGTTTATVPANASGVATSPTFTANATAGGPYTVTAKVSGVTTAASFTLTNTVGAPATITAMSGSGQSAQVSHAFSNPLVATVNDAGGNLVSGASVTFTAPASGASGTFAGSTTVTVKTNASGLATSPAFTANATAGSYAVKATVAGVATAASFALTNTAATQPVTPTFTLTGVPTTQTPGTNITNATITLTPASSTALAGTLSVTLSSTDTGFPAGNPADAGFGTGFGGKPTTANISVPAGATSVPFPTLDPGTVAGTLTATFTVAGQTPTASTVTIEPLAPIIEAGSVQIVDVTSTGFNVEVVATSTTLDLKTATFTFAAASGSQISGTSSFTADVSKLLPTWFSTASNFQYGGAFSLSIPFTISGPASAIGSVSVTLTNSVGTSSPVSGTQ